MQYLLKIFIINIFLLSLSNQNILNCNGSLAYNEQDFIRIRLGCTNMKGSNLILAPLQKYNLDGVNLSNSFLLSTGFKKASLKKAKFNKANAQSASFRWADLESSDLSHGNFSGAYFFGANLNGITAIDANFKNATGLTNETKAILREQGAKNVPPDLTDEEFEKERINVENQLRCKFVELLEYILCPVLNPIIKGSEFFLAPVLKGTETVLGYILTPVIKGSDKISDYLDSFLQKIGLEEKIE